LAIKLGLKRPTAEQCAIITAPLAPTLVVAGAGSGKTNTMAARVVYLVANGLVAPGHILGLTFTRKAAGELSHRINRQLAQLDRYEGRGICGVDAPTVATYHSYAASLVQDHALRLGIDPDSQLLTPGAGWQLAMEVVESSDLPPEDRAVSTLTGLVLKLAAECVDNSCSPQQAAAEFEAIAQDLESKLPSASPTTGYRLTSPGQWMKNATASLRQRATLTPLVQRYLDLKRQRGLMDYADQVALAVQVVDRFEQVGQGERARFQAVLLDEYQDTSALQIKLMQGLFQGHPVMAVGDPNQAIYGWRGASAEGLAGFPGHFAAPCQDGQLPQDVGVLTLSTAWRNDKAILDAANVISDPLRHSFGQAMEALKPNRQAGAGKVQAAYFTEQSEEAQAIAAYLAREWHQAPPVGQRRRTAAVLCRARSAFGPVAQALQQAGLPHEVVGLGGLVELPEVQDVLAALTAAEDPDRPEALLRLAMSPRFALGLSDLDALARLAKVLTSQSMPGVPDQAAAPDGATSGSALANRPQPANPVSIIDALAQLRPDQAGLFTAVGYRRLKRLGQVLSRVRALRHLPIPELILHTERALGLDVDLLARAGTAGRVHLDQLVVTAREFQAGGGSGIGSFLEWVEVESDRGRGLAPGQVTVNDRAVQVMTIHAAKGLEWDVVSVCGLSQGRFPAVENQKNLFGLEDSGYLTTGRGESSNLLPWPLRLDRAALPSFEHEATQDVVELKDTHQAFVQAAGKHKLAEDRRLAYVAMTRARSHLLLTGSWWHGERTTSLPPSTFLEELSAAGLVDATDWAPEPEKGQNPAKLVPRQAVWPPQAPPDQHGLAVRAAAEQVKAHLGAVGSNSQAMAVLSSMDGELAAQALMLLRERAGRASGPQLELPEHLSVTAADQLVRQPAAFALAARRPLPTEPSRAATLGQMFHDRVESLLHSWSGQETLELDQDWQPSPDSAVGRRLDTLVDNFKRSWWADQSNGLRLVETEQSLTVNVGGFVLRGRADAIFEDVQGDLVLVDWKTGGLDSKTGGPKPEHTTQLELYRAMVAQVRSIPAARIQAAIYYARNSQTCWLDPPGPNHSLDALADKLSALVI